MPGRERACPVPQRPAHTRIVTGIMDHTRGVSGVVHGPAAGARPRTLGRGRRRLAVRTRQGTQGRNQDGCPGWVPGNARPRFATELPEAITDVDAFRVVKLGGAALGDPPDPAEVPPEVPQHLPRSSHAATRIGRRSSFPSCPIPEVARPGRTLRAWKQAILAYFEHPRLVEQTHRSDQWGHRNHPQNRARLPRLHQLSAMVEK